MHRGVYWARMITFFVLGMVTYVVAKDLISCECQCGTTLSMNAGLEDSVPTLKVDLADESGYLSELLNEASSSFSSTFETNSKDPKNPAELIDSPAGSRFLSIKT